MYDYLTPLSPLLLTSTGFSLIPHSVRGVQIRSELIRLAQSDRYHSCAKCLKPEPIAVTLHGPGQYRASYSSEDDITYDRYFEEMALIEAVKYGAQPGRRRNSLPNGSQCDVLLMAMLTHGRSKRKDERDEEFDELYDRFEWFDDEPF